MPPFCGWSNCGRAREVLNPRSEIFRPKSDAKAGSEAARSFFSLLLGSALGAFRRSERQAGGAAHHLTLLIGKHAFEAIRIDYLFALIRRHIAQVFNGCFDHALAIRRELAKLAVDLPSLLLLLRRQVLPSFHAVKHAQLLLGRKIREMLQPLTQHLLPLWRQTAKRWIVLQRPLLLFRRKICIVTQPIPGVARRSILMGPRNLCARRRRCRCLPFLLGQRRAGYGECDRQDRSSQTHNDVIAPPHSALSMNFALFALSLGTARPLWIRRDILLHIQIVKQVEIGIHIVILVQCLEITDRAARSGIHNLHWLRLKMPFLSKE
jgi:hypothetical protein